MTMFDLIHGKPQILLLLLLTFAERFCGARLLIEQVTSCDTAPGVTLRNSGDSSVVTGTPGGWYCPLTTIWVPVRLAMSSWVTLLVRLYLMGAGASLITTSLRIRSSSIFGPKLFIGAVPLVLRSCPKVASVSKLHRSVFLSTHH